MHQDAELDGNNELSVFCKALNGSYRYDAMNTEKYAQTRICDKDRVLLHVLSHKLKDRHEMGDDVYVVSLENENFKCDTCL